MKLFHKLAIFAMAAVSVFALAQSVDPNQVLKEISEAQNKAIADARAAGAAADFAAIQKNAVEKAKAAVKGVDPEKVDPKLGFAWASLFSRAEMHKEACAAANRFLSSNPTPEEKFRAQSLMIRSCNELGEADMIVMTLGMMTPPDPMSAFGLANIAANVYIDTINQKLGADEALKALDKVAAMLPEAEKLTDKEKPQLYASIAMIAQTRSEVLSGAGKTSEAVDALDKALLFLPESDKNVRGLKMAKTRLTMLNAPAPALKIERSHGTFSGLESLKGKVVILDFFAHWCGPCIRSFPDMKKLYADLQPKGLEIVGLTTYYGYYKKENVEKRDMTRDTEFAKMGEFIADHQLPWPVAYGERANFEAYGITGIPHVVVIDRAGTVHKIKIGYSPETFVKFREEVEKLVNEK